MIRLEQVYFTTCQSITSLPVYDQKMINRRKYKVTVLKMLINLQDETDSPKDLRRKLLNSAVSSLSSLDLKDI